MLVVLQMYLQVVLGAGLGDLKPSYFGQRDFPATCRSGRIMATGQPGTGRFN